MTDKLNKTLSEKLNLNEETQQIIQEEWNNKLSEAREEIAAELREEFAQKFTHDKEVIVETMDKFLNEQLDREIRELAEDKKSLTAERVAYKKKVKEHTNLLNRFINERLANEVKAQRAERNELKKGMSVLENFVLKQLAEEIKEFHSDKKALQEQRVKLVREGKGQLVQAKKDFVKRAAKVVNETVEKSLRNEITQLKEDIQVARENDFGRQLFEAFAGTYMTSYLNEGSESTKLQKVIDDQNQKLEEANKKLEEQQALNESMNKKLSASKDLFEREKKLGKLLSSLGKDKKSIMSELLESVRTEDLDRKFNQYLPAVLNESGNTRNTQRNRKALNESVKSEKTGNRASNTAQDDDNVSELEQMRKLAGL